MNLCGCWTKLLGFHGPLRNLVVVKLETFVFREKAPSIYSA